MIFPFAALDHSSAEFACEHELCGQVDLDNSVPQFVPMVDRRPAFDCSGIEHKDVKRWEIRCQFSCERVLCVTVTEVVTVGAKPPPECSDLRRDVVIRLERCACARDVGAGSS